jgi:GNAT superfamily N-acetyltransferase
VDVDVFEMDGALLPQLRDMLRRAGYTSLAEQLPERAQEPWHWYVACTDDLVGYVEGRFDFEPEDQHSQADHPAPWAFVKDIVVDPAVRQCGVGSALMKRFVEDAAKAGCTYVALRVNLMDGPGLQIRTEFFYGRGFAALETLLPGRNDLPDVMGASVAAVSEGCASGPRTRG